MSEKICDVHGCGKVAMAFSDLVVTEPTSFLIFFHSTDFETKIFARLCREHYGLAFKATLDLLKNE